MPETALGNVYIHLIFHSMPINLRSRCHFPDKAMRLRECPSHGWRGGNGEGRVSSSQIAESELLGPQTLIYKSTSDSSPNMMTFLAYLIFLGNRAPPRKPRAENTAAGCQRSRNSFSLLLSQHFLLIKKKMVFIDF